MKPKQPKENNNLLTALMVIILILAIGQTFQINDIKEGMQKGTLSISKAVQTTTQTVAQAQQQRAPTMVGGC